jgi:hypothetical protein
VIITEMVISTRKENLSPPRSLYSQRSASCCGQLLDLACEVDRAQKNDRGPNKFKIELLQYDPIMSFDIDM